MLRPLQCTEQGTTTCPIRVFLRVYAHSIRQPDVSELSGVCPIRNRNCSTQSASDSSPSSLSRLQDGLDASQRPYEQAYRPLQSSDTAYFCTDSIAFSRQHPSTPHRIRSELRSASALCASHRAYEQQCHSGV